MAEKISYFEMKNFRALNTLTRYLNISKIKVVIQITFSRNPRIQMDLLKNNCFSAEKAKIIFLAPRKERRYQYMKCLSSLSLCPPPCFQFYHGTEDAYRGSSTISPSSKLELLCQYEMTSTVTKNSITDDLGVRDPLLVCLFSVQNITKKIKT